MNNSLNFNDFYVVEKYNLDNFRLILYNKILSEIDISKPFMVIPEYRELNYNDICDIANSKYKRLDGQFIYNGELISREQIEKEIFNAYILVCFKVKYIEKKSLDTEIFMYE